MCCRGAPLQKRMPHAPPSPLLLPGTATVSPFTCDAFTMAIASSLRGAGGGEVAAPGAEGAGGAEVGMPSGTPPQFGGLVASPPPPAVVVVVAMGAGPPPLAVEVWRARFSIFQSGTGCDGLARRGRAWREKECGPRLKSFFTFRRTSSLFRGRRTARPSLPQNPQNLPTMGDQEARRVYHRAMAAAALASAVAAEQAGRVPPAPPTGHSDPSAADKCRAVPGQRHDHRVASSLLRRDDGGEGGHTVGVVLGMEAGLTVMHRGIDGSRKVCIGPGRPS